MTDGRTIDVASLYPVSARPAVTGPVIDMDQHFNEDVDTWAEVALEPRRKLCFRSDEWGRRHLYLGDRYVGPGRATHADEYVRIARIVAEDEGAYERELAEREKRPPSFEELVDPTASDMRLRVLAMDRACADYAIQFPSYGFFWPEVVEGLDAGVIHPHMQAWNTWIAKQCGSVASRVGGVGQIGWYDPEAAADEIYRCAELGLVGVTVAMKPFRGLPWSDESNEPIWRALDDTRLLLFLHIVLMSHSLDPAWEKAEHPDHSGPDLVTMVNRNLPAEAALTDLVLGGILERHPGMRVVTVECGGLWVETFMQRIDWAYDFLGPRNRYLRRVLPEKPSTYLRRQVRFAAFPFEPVTRFMLEEGRDLFMYATDFPHDEGTAEGIAIFERSLDAVRAPRSQRQRFYVDNARELLGHRGLGV